MSTVICSYSMHTETIKVDSMLKKQVIIKDCTIMNPIQV
uniref:Uncharacterized protein n=1 Tax=Ciona intestinalis TaxID=7719 RepID=H2XPR9_CIOIN